MENLLGLLKSNQRIFLNNDNVQKYEEFLNDVLKVDLRNELEKKDKLYERISQHSQLKQTINCILDAELGDGLHTQMDLGSNFYVQTHISDTSKIFVNIGLDIHLEMNLQEAVDYCDQKLKILNEEVSLSTKRIIKIKGQIKFILLALQEMQGIKHLSY